MDFYKLRTSEYRIAIVGLLASGKTVFLTSLINHLKDHDPDRFTLGKSVAAGKNAVTIRKFQELQPGKGWERFPYERYREAIISGKWPEKTKDRFQYACTFERTDWRLTAAKVKFYDLPGERIADAVMAVHDYAGWSDHVLSQLKNDSGYRECSRDFLALLDVTSITEAALLTAYKQTMARLILAYKPNVSPSTFLLDIHGRVNKKPKTVEGMAAAFHAGIDQTSEFVPLPEKTRNANSELAARFAMSYEAYKRQVVSPLITSLKSCHAMIVLVDVLMLLAGGVGMYDDNRQMLVDLLKVLNPGGAFHKKMVQMLGGVLPHQWRPGGISRIAFVAPKLDQVWPQDRDHMITLLKRMVQKPAQDYSNLRREFFNCSAVRSAETLPMEEGQRWLRGSPIWDAPTGKKMPRGETQKLRVSELPQDWPRDWRVGDYSFPEVYPRMPSRKDCPPDQVNLDNIFNFIMV